MNPNTSSDPSSVLNFLAEIGVDCADDLKHLGEAQFNQLLKH